MRERHGAAAGEGRVDAELADGTPVQAYLLDPVGVGVVEDRVAGSGARVIADEQGGIEAAVDAMYHRARLGIAAQELRRRVQLLGKEVPHEPMAVVHDDLRGAG